MAKIGIKEGLIATAVMSLSVVFWFVSSQAMENNIGSEICAESYSKVARMVIIKPDLTNEIKVSFADKKITTKEFWEIERNFAKKEDVDKRLRFEKEALTVVLNRTTHNSKDN